ncbi:MAG: TetR/AcrR family transcriptional regulator [Verrucomicrobiota bacterium]
MSSSSYHHGNLRNAILQAGLKHLEAEGADSLSLRKMTDKIGVSHTAAYRHFQDKPAFLADLAAHGFDQLSANAREAFGAHSDDPKAALCAYGQAYVLFAVEHPNLFRVMFGSERLGGGDSAKHAFDLLIEAVERNRASGFIQTEDVRPKVMSCWAMVHGLASLAVDGQLKGVENLSDLIESALQDLIYGLGR